MAMRELLPGEYAVLGLLALKPMHGYEMARYFDDDLVDICPVEQSLLYTYVRNVEGRGLVAWKEARVGNRPPRKVYHLTPEGADAFEYWLAQPVDRLREVRLDFLLKLYFLHRLQPGSEQQLLDSQIHVCTAYLDDASRRVAAASGFARLVAGSKESAARATLDWLRACRDELGDKDGPGAQAC